MSNKLEKQFFDTFGIEPLIKNIPCSECEFNLEECGCFYCNREVYPQITDHILLELICILGNTNYFLITDEGLPIDIDGLKKSVLHSLTL